MDPPVLSPSMHAPAGSPSPRPRASMASAAAAAAAAAPAQSDSSELSLMFEEQLRVASIAVAELQALVQQRRRGAASAQPQQSRSTGAGGADTASLAYASLTAAQAEALTGHLLLTSHTLLHQLATQWSVRRGGAVPPAALRAQCHDPSPLPLPKEQPCVCKADVVARSLAASDAVNSDLDDASRAAASDVFDLVPPPQSPTSSIGSASVKRNVLPYCHIGLLEKNIVGGAKGATGARATAGASTRWDSDLSSAPPRDLQLLQTHFSQLLSCPPAAATPLSPSVAQQTPLSHVHPFGIVLGEFLTHWKHQALYIASSSSAAAEDHSAAASSIAAVAASSQVPRLVIDRPFLQAQLSSLFSFLSSHETLLLLSYPHLHQTHLCKKVLRRVLRASVLDHPSVFPLLLSWSEHANQAEDEQVRTKLASMQRVTLEDIGLAWPFTLCALPLVHPELRVGEGVEGLGASSATRNRHRRTFPQARNRFGEDEEDEDVESASESDEDDELRFRPSLSPLSGDTGDDGSSGNPSSAGSPIDTLIHSDDEQAARRRREVLGLDHQRAAQQEHHERAGNMHRTPRSSQRRRRTAAHVLRETGPSSRAAAASAIPLGSLTGSGASSVQANPIGADEDADASAAGVAHSLRRLSLEDDEDEQNQSSARTTGASPSSLPYNRSIALLSTLDDAQGVDAKLQVLVHTCRSIGDELRQFVQQHCHEHPVGAFSAAMPTDALPGDAAAHPSVQNNNNPATAITCDDLFQILCFCLMHASVRAPVATLALLSECIDAAALNGEMGYVLISLQCAIQLVLGWNPEVAAKERLERAQATAAQAAAQAALMIPVRTTVPSTPPLQPSSFVDEGEYYMPSGGSMPTTPSVGVGAMTHRSSFSSGGSKGMRVAGSGAPSTPTYSTSSASSSSASSSSSAATTPKASSSSSTFSSSGPGAMQTFQGSGLYSARLLAQLDSFCLAADYLSQDGGWQWLFMRDGVNVSKKLTAESSVHSIKGMGIIHRPIGLVHAFLRNIHNRSLIDDLFLKGLVVAHLSADTKIVRYFFKARNWCTRQQSDMVLLHHTGTCSDGVSKLVLAFSVTHPAAPPSPNYSRATVRASGWLLKPIHGGAATAVTYVVSPDANGFPSWVVNMVATKQPLIVAALASYLEQTTRPDGSPLSPTSAARPAVGPASP